jgi:exosome complex RNA-binding protein Csl4
MQKFRRVAAYTLLTGTLALTGGCFGTFPMTRTVYRANSNVYSSVPGDTTQRKIAQSAVMWVFIPVYAVVGIADAAVFNVIEFWTGNRTAISSVQIQGNDVALEPSADGREATLTIKRGGQVLGQERLVKVSDRVLEIHDLKGGLKGTMVRTGNGQIEMKDAQGRTIQTFAEQMR